MKTGNDSGIVWIGNNLNNSLGCPKDLAEKRVVINELTLHKFASGQPGRAFRLR